MSAPTAGTVRPSPTTAAATGTAQSVRPMLATVGSKRVVRNFCRRVTFMLSSPYLTSWRRSLCRTRKSCTHRLVALVDDQVTFRWRDRAHHNEPKLMTLSLDVFLRRFLLHLLPRGFVRIRHFGFLANRRRATLLPLCFQLLGPIPQPQIEPAASAARLSARSPLVRLAPEKSSCP